MSQGNLTGRKVLVVEDNYLQAKTIAEALADHGAEVLGPFPAPEECLPYCVRDQIDAAVLDVKVGEADSFPVADRLVREDIPFIFLTGYDRNIIPRRFKGVPHYLKPFVGQDAPAAVALVMALRRRTRVPD
ncbi:response regulator (plasmid) [Rhizobium indicum]|uniref:response regulator n=1 Tax=Rhizobium indicum TaxID=2583231 RepID=UPI0015714E31|nr:response regulator [Rhizobium indicum]QKK33419.1 response regulator [Rhizobium indicum]